MSYAGFKPFDGRVDAQARTTATTTNGSGVATITHGLGYTPTVVLAKVSGTTTFVADANSYTGTQFTVTVSNRATGAVLASTAVSAEWVAWP